VTAIETGGPGGGEMGAGPARGVSQLEIWPEALLFKTTG